jgi:hypothetical protein
MSDDNHIELRVKYPGYPYVALINGLDHRFGLNRVWAEYLCNIRRERFEDGTQEKVYMLPDMDALYEIRETFDGQRTFRYVAVREGDPQLYPLTRSMVEAVAEGAITLEAAIERVARAKHPEISVEADDGS